MPPPSAPSPSKGVAGSTGAMSLVDSAVVGKRVVLNPSPSQGRSSATAPGPSPGSPTTQPLSGCRAEGARRHEEEDELEAEVRLLVSAIARRASKGFTGETWYDFDLPLARTDPITIIHFNDVYNIECRSDGSGGVSRFVTAVQSFQHLHPLILFSGDVFNPSVMSTYTRGRHMIPFLNLLKVHTACFGNHDFDFGIDELEYAVGSCNFPWLISNVFEKTGQDMSNRAFTSLRTMRDDLGPARRGSRQQPCLDVHGSGLEPSDTASAGADGTVTHSPRSRETEDREGHHSTSQFGFAPDKAEGLFAEDFVEVHGLPLANGMKYRLFEWQGIRVGIIGLVEREWLDTLACVGKDDVYYVDFVEAANCLSRILRQKECELVIALTHMRAPNDERLAKEAVDIDLILGGHDHDYYGLQRIGDISVVKSGTDFREFTVLTIYPGQGAELSGPVHVAAARNGQQSHERTDVTPHSLSAECRDRAVEASHGVSALPASADTTGMSIKVRRPNDVPESKREVAPCQFSPTSSREASSTRPVPEPQTDSQGAKAARREKKNGDFSPVFGAASGPVTVVGKVTGDGMKGVAVSPSRSPGSPGSPLLSPNSGPGTPTLTPKFLSPSAVSEEVVRRERTTNSDLYSGPLLPTELNGGEETMPFFLGGSIVQWTRVRVEKDRYEKNKHVELLVKKYEQNLKKQMKEILVDAGCDLETRFSVIRTSESNVGNWLCDIMRRECRADIAILNSGTIRSDCIFSPGPFRFGDLAAMLPMADTLCVIAVPGNVLVEVLENSVSQLPKTEGRFLQVAGLRFSFDSSRPSGARVIRESIKVAKDACGGLRSGVSTPRAEGGVMGEMRGGDEDECFVPLNPEKVYSVATKSYLAQGRDGYCMLKGCKLLLDEELLPPLPTMVRSTLSIAELANGLKRPHSRITFKRLTSFTSMRQDDMLKDFGCCQTSKYNYVLAPRGDGRIVDLSANA